ncbi:GNAT family N-acetyltransferase [Virgibacillus doumboii]|uniref:GNAT family N-acetyltransferase n=1 Tax=Virgibacillus doumboii TaxID=2697503 RepID=UPI0013DF8168|nr:GNAT family N-acetyltransferase [Virgibacillus doumboii]
MESDRTAFDRLDIYRKVKIVEGEKFVTIEDTKSLGEDEMVEFVTHFIDDLAFEDVPSVNVLVNNRFSEKVERMLKEKSFQLHDEVVMVRKQLDDMLSGADDLTFSLRSLHELPLEEFISVWKKSAANSPNASSVLNMDEQMQNVRKELGPGYQDTCLVAYDGGKPVGVVMPHIEPGTLDEGRLFYFGLVPEERGKRKSKVLHQQALRVLKEDFGASYYIGSTSTANIPMLKTFKENGCSVIERDRVYTRKRS